MWPGTFGTHNWQPMSFSPKLNLAFIPTIRQADAYSSEGIDAASWQPKKNRGNTGMGALPKDGTFRVPTEEFGSTLQAWDPVRQKQAWSITTPGIVNGGTMATAGGLVFQGHLDGTINAFDASTGRKLWSFFAGVSVLGAPITYEVDGRQYITVTAGPPIGPPASVLFQQAKFGWRYRDHPRRVLTFALNGTGKLPPTPPPGIEAPLISNALRPDPRLAEEGALTYNTRCRSCHGLNAVAMGGGPDLRASAIPLDAEAFRQVVLGGALVARGMPQFDDLTDADLLPLRHYIRGQAALPQPTGTERTKKTAGQPGDV
jgi:quinohemoprotein ethanol dehydrogenase